MIVLYTDFGNRDPYVGQLHAAIRRAADVPVVDLLHDVPDFSPRAGAYLLDALQRQFARGDVFVCVVDPGVGGERAPVMVRADGKWYVGPDNGLLSVVCRRAESVECFRVDRRPEKLSSSFHGRDLFAPVAAMVAAGDMPDRSPWTLVDASAWPEELGEVIYIDHYGNAMSGLVADGLSAHCAVRVGGRRLRWGSGFHAMPDGEPFWYSNSLGLVEIAVKEQSAADVLGLTVGDPVDITDYAGLPDGS